MTILTLEDVAIAQMIQAAVVGDCNHLESVACLGPTYVALRRGAQLQRAYWDYSLELRETCQAIVSAAIAPASTSDSDTLELCFTHHYRAITPDQFRRAFAKVHIGIRGIELQYKDQIARYSPTSMIARNLTFQRVFEQFLEQTSLSEKAFFKQGTIQTFEARQVLITFRSEVTAVTMHRGSQVVPIKTLSSDCLQDMTTTMGQWLLRQVQADGRLPYKYFPSRGREATSNNLIRQFMATLCLIRYAQRSGRLDHQVLATHNLNYNLAQFYHWEGKLGVVEYDGKVKLGAIALAALAILEHADLLSIEVFDSVYGAHLEGLCRTIETLWQSDGSFRTFLKPRDRTDNQNFYPGEALLFWASLYQRTQDPQLLARCYQSAAYYRTWHQQQRNPAFVPWHTQAYALLYRATQDRYFLDLIFALNDWLLARQQWEGARYDDLRGRFYDPHHPGYGPPHASSTGVYLEGIADAYALAVETGEVERAQHYQQVIWRGLRSIRQLQFRESTDLFYISQRSPVYGAVRTTVYDNVIRIDNVQHCLMALMKLIQCPAFLHSTPNLKAADIDRSEPPLPAQVFTRAEATTLKNFRLVDPQVDIRPLIAEIKANEHLWLHNTSRQDKVKVQRETHTIYLRSAVKPYPPGVTNGNDVHDSCRTQLAQYFPTVMQWLETYAQASGGALGRATIVRLAPQGRVYRHIDQGEYYRLRDRYHLVLQSSVGSLLNAGDEWVRMHPGEFWWFDNQSPHEAYNEADDWRIHLIFDCDKRWQQKSGTSITPPITL
ncbi:MAG: aspartyl/asparaginyl beta-hydroxylase domain-containing protein [Leptolyngbya sp. SIO1E4]|nr:aspartyl/asparaginyl beta-hydroxylase domain-containing protein [Leptolyngbya sp. SIO1E4]